MIRVLHVFGRMDRGGAEAMIMDVYRKIDRNKVQFDFAVHTTESCAYDSEIKSLGGRIFHIPRLNGANVIQYIKAWKKLIYEHVEWKIVHGHVRSTASIYLGIARKSKRITIAHSHNVSSGSGVKAKVKDVLQLPLRFMCDYYMACSRDAGKWLFGKRVCESDKFFVIKNAINIEKFRFRENIRNKIRKELGLDGCYVVGHVGRFNPQKNHIFLVDVFSEIKKKNSDAVLVLLGDGELRQDIEKRVEEQGLQESVLFLGVKTNVEDFLSAMDVFIFPSRFEGLGIALIEAQANGLRCLTSENVVPLDAKVTPLLQFISLGQSAEYWAEQAIKQPDCLHREVYYEMVDQEGYNIENTFMWLQEFYIEEGEKM